MQAFAFLGVPAPWLQPAFIRINDTDFGLYLAVEDVNDDFMHNHFGDGSLYRCENAERAVVGHGLYAKVDHGSEAIERLFDVMDQEGDVGVCLDVDEALRFFACETFLYNTDGLAVNKNAYLCESDSGFVLVPWDEEDSFNVFDTDAQSGKRIRSFEEKAALLFRLLLRDESRRDRYYAYIRRLNDEFLNPDTFLPWLENYIRFLAPYFRRDPTILYNPDDIVAELTQGDGIFNSMTGNLLLSFREYHDQLNEQFHDPDACFHVESSRIQTWSDEELQKMNDKYLASGKLRRRICAGYWRIRRQAYFEMYGRQTIVIGAAFAAVFTAALCAVFVPRSKRRHTQRRRSDA